MLLAFRGRILAAFGVLLFGGAIILPACSGTKAATQIITEQGRGLTAFRSDEELRAFLRRAGERRARQENYDANGVAVTVSPPASPPAPMAMEAAPSADTGASASITNNQEAGVDEGSIVKNWRDYLVVLRRGRLFTVSLAGGAMRPVDAINAFPPGVSGRGDWYDEMLVAGDRVIVIGYSYARGGTEVNRFRIAANGRLTFEDAYHLRSNDYYSSRNYASRLIGNRLIYYTPLYLGARGDDPLDALPGLRRWGPDGSRSAFRRIADARRVFIAPSMRDRENAPVEALHSVIDCDLTAVEVDCEATAVLGPSSRNFYVSANAVYLFVSESGYGPGRGGRAAQSWVYRLPFARRDTPAAIGARGVPIDQFSFREDGAARRLDILVQASGGGDAMFGPERVEGSRLALLQLPLSAFGDGSAEASRRFYRVLPSLGGDTYDLHNRFVGGHLLYGAGGSGNGEQRAYRIVAVPVAGGSATTLPLSHGIERIEAMGGDAVAIGGTGDDLGFSAIRLGRGAPTLGERYIQRAAGQGESRSHGFFFRPDAGTNGTSGTIGLPIARPVDERYRRFFGTTAAMLFLRRDARAFAPAGELAARPEGTVDDSCQASCVDWYGNARPIFLGERVFALLGYELVEGRLGRGRISEIGRTSFAPGGRRRN